VEPFRDLQERQSVEAFPGALDVGVKETRFSMRHRVLRTARLILQRRTRRLRACGPLVSGALTTGLSRGKGLPKRQEWLGAIIPTAQDQPEVLRAISISCERNRLRASGVCGGH
jgi:hypothetical protein